MCLCLCTVLESLSPRSVVYSVVHPYAAGNLYNQLIFNLWRVMFRDDGNQQGELSIGVKRNGKRKNSFPPGYLSNKMSAKFTRPPHKAHETL